MVNNFRLFSLSGFSLVLGLIVALPLQAKSNFNYSQFQAQFGFAYFDQPFLIEHDNQVDEYSNLQIWGRRWRCI